MATATALIEAAHGATDVQVREDLTAAMSSVWARLGAPGSTLTGAQRLGLARTVRRALTDPAPLPPWVKPSTVDQRLADPDIGPHLADAAYRLTLHAATLSEEWYRDTLSMAELTPQQWVETIEVVVAVVAIDGFSRAAGLPVADLPEAQPGEPTGVGDLPTKPARHHWVPVLHLEDDEHGYWGGAPVVPPVIRALSAVPESQRSRDELISAMYMTGADMADLDFTRGTLDRRQIELVASRLSALRECFY